MIIRTDIRKTVGEARAAITDPKPLHAVTGAGDLLVERVRIAAAAQQDAMRSIRLELAAVQELVRSTIENIRGVFTGFPERAEDSVADGSGQADQTYDGLAERGADLVRRIRSQQATQDLADRVDTMVRAAKATSTTARNAGATTKSRVKATVTSARNVTTAAGVAASAAASKTGDTGPATTPTTSRASAPHKATASAKNTSTPADDDPEA